jgi:hypothetical protein
MNFNKEKELVVCKLDENIFNDLTQMELCQHLNGIALSTEEQKRIREDVKNLLGNSFL